MAWSMVAWSAGRSSAKRMIAGLAWSINAKRALVPPMSPISAGRGMSSAAIASVPTRAQKQGLPDRNFGGAPIERHRDLVDHGKPRQRLDVDVVVQRRCLMG